MRVQVLDKLQLASELSIVSKEFRFTDTPVIHPEAQSFIPYKLSCADSFFNRFYLVGFGVNLVL
ncbi:MAG: hypothetical protein SAJ12_12495 [Jaaginema sp. PMC 1079.18]|nr:hypothetical protein [Jaaginema sp. PMC 1079.18]